MAPAPTGAPDPSSRGPRTDRQGAPGSRGEERAALAVVVPTLNAAGRLDATLAALAPGRDLVREIVVVDGGSADGTPDLARRLGARVVPAPRGRGVQLRAGGEATDAPWLLFLHADTRLAPAWAAAAGAFMDGAGDRAGVFRLRLDDAAPAARRLERIVAWRTRALGLPYGDQGLLVARALYDALGGYAPIPLMEDVDLVRRLGRRRIVLLDADAITSAERYRRGGYLARPARNLGVLALYFAGVSPERLARLYG